MEKSVVYAGLIDISGHRYADQLLASNAEIVRSASNVTPKQADVEAGKVIDIAVYVRSADRSIANTMADWLQDEKINVASPTDEVKKLIASKHRSVTASVVTAIAGTISRKATKAAFAEKYDLAYLFPDATVPGRPVGSIPTFQTLIDVDAFGASEDHLSDWYVNASDGSVQPIRWTMKDRLQSGERWIGYMVSNLAGRKFAFGAPVAVGTSSIQRMAVDSTIGGIFGYNADAANCGLPAVSPVTMFALSQSSKSGFTIEGIFDHPIALIEACKRENVSSGRVSITLPRTLATDKAFNATLEEVTKQTTLNGSFTWEEGSQKAIDKERKNVIAALDKEDSALKG